MTRRKNALIALSFCASMVGTAPAVHADIIGLGNGAGWQLNNNGSGFNPSISGGTLTLTSSGTFSTANSAYFGTQQYVGNFVADYSYTTANAGADGVAFILQSNSAGALGGGGGGLGYSGVANSAAVEYNVFSPNIIGTAIRTGGATGFPYTPTGSVGLSNNTVNVHAAYDGVNLTQTITQGSNSFTQSARVNTVNALNASSGFIGFSGGTGGATADQSVANFKFTANPAVIGTFASNFNSGTPAGVTLRGTAAVDGNGGVGNTGKLRLTDTGGGEIGSAVIGDLAPGRVARGFSASFDLFQGNGNGADGSSFSFGSAPGGAFGENGYGTGHSLAVSLDTFNNSGEAPAINVYINGNLVPKSNSQNTRDDNNFIATTVSYNAALNRIAVTYNGTLFTFNTAGFTPQAGDVFGFGGRTGGLVDNHFIDNAVINETIPAPAALPTGLALMGLLGLKRRRR